MVAVALATACSSTNTGTGTSTSSGGLFGGGSSSTSGGVTSSSSGASGSCTTDDTDACDICAAGKCCTQYNACAGDTECTALYECLTGCSGDETCRNNCATQHPNGVDGINNFASCVDSSCATECNGGASSGSSGSSSGGMPSGCLEDPPSGGTNCASGTIPHDCPNGKPYASCTADPGGLTGIWCCSQ